jgi:hypothetical protein
MPQHNANIQVENVCHVTIMLPAHPSTLLQGTQQKKQQAAKWAPQLQKEKEAANHAKDEQE